MLTFFEFFAGGGMARLGLGEGWKCLLANDISPKKASTYLQNFPDAIHHFKLGDVRSLSGVDISGGSDLLWGSFPCQDLSVAGNGAGLDGDRSGVFWPFWQLVQRLICCGKCPSVVVLENVEGTLTSHNGTDFRSIVGAMVDAGFRVGALTMDAVHFVPQSRPRLFFIAVRAEHAVSPTLQHLPIDPERFPVSIWHSDGLRTAYQGLSQRQKAAWLWWNVPVPPKRNLQLEDILEPAPNLKWNSAEGTVRLLSMMSEINLAKVQRARRAGKRIVGSVYKRTRARVQRAEVRFDGISGCLRTPGGGSSRQTILEVNGPSVRSRLLSPREAARLMGLPETYTLPENYNDAYRIAGDGLVVPVVAWLEQHLLRPLLSKSAADQIPEIEGRGNFSTNPVQIELIMHA